MFIFGWMELLVILLVGGLVIGGVVAGVAAIVIARAERKRRVGGQSSG